VKKAANDSSEAAAAAFVSSGFALMAYTSQGASYEELVSMNDKNKNGEPLSSGDSSGSRCASAYLSSEDSLLSVSTLGGVQPNFSSGGEHSKSTSGGVHSYLGLSSGSTLDREQYYFPSGGEYSKLTSGEVLNSLVLSSGSSFGEEQFIFTPGFPCRVE
jgi:hypothetical protein